MPTFNSDKKLELEIHSCSECPYNFYVEPMKIGFGNGLDTGYDWFCKKLRGIAYSAWTDKKCQYDIRDECPLPNVRKK